MFEVARLSQAKERLASAKAQGLAEISRLEEAFSGPDEDRRKLLRDAAIGMHFEILTAATGRTFENARVVKIEDGGISIRHEHGAATLKYGDLTPEQRREFGSPASSPSWQCWLRMILYCVKRPGSRPRPQIMVNPEGVFRILEGMPKKTCMRWFGAGKVVRVCDLFTEGIPVTSPF